MSAHPSEEPVSASTYSLCGNSYDAADASDTEAVRIWHPLLPALAWTNFCPSPASDSEV